MLNRVVIYLKEMFPVLHISGTIIYASGFIWLQTVLNRESLPSFMHFAVGSISLLCFVLLIRIMDEFKDYEDDLKNFPDRPLPSGRVLKSDLKALGFGCFFLPLLLNLFISTDALIWTLIVLGFSLLMLKWFFIESTMRKSLPLALISHHPIVFIHLIYLFSVFKAAVPEANLLYLGTIIPIGLLSTNWEFSRKLRAPKEETEYTTYSKIWGVKAATSAAIITQLLSFSLLVYFIGTMTVPLSLWVVFGFVYLSITFQYVQFYHNPKNGLALKSKAENMSLITQLFILSYSYLLMGSY